MVHKTATANACNLLHELKPLFYCGSTSVLPNLFLFIAHVANETYVQHQAINRKDHSWLENNACTSWRPPRKQMGWNNSYLFWKLGSKFLQSIKREGQQWQGHLTSSKIFFILYLLWVLLAVKLSWIAKTKFTASPKSIFCSIHGLDKRRSSESINLIKIWQRILFSNNGFVFETPVDFLLAYILI